MHKSFAFFLI